MSARNGDGHDLEATLIREALKAGARITLPSGAVIEPALGVPAPSAKPKPEPKPEPKSEPKSEPEPTKRGGSGSRWTAEEDAILVATNSVRKALQKVRGRTKGAVQARLSVLRATTPGMGTERKIRPRADWSVLLPTTLSAVQAMYEATLAPAPLKEIHALVTTAGIDVYTETVRTALHKLTAAGKLKHNTPHDTKLPHTWEPV